MTVKGQPLLGEADIYLLNEGTHMRVHDFLGAHPGVHAGTVGCRFAVWAPNAESVSVIGDFNDWDPAAAPMASEGVSGVWAAFLPGVVSGQAYKYHLVSRDRSHVVDKADPVAFATERPPRTASVVWQSTHAWGDQEWFRTRVSHNSAQSPWSVYEVHLGSWMRSGPGPEDFLSYRQLAPRLAAYAAEMAFTHVELLPVMEHPFYGSWGYQTTGYFAPSRRFGDPDDLKFMIDTLHQAGIGVILDWVPSHFPSDEFALAYFDGTHLYEHADPRLGFHPDWNSSIFNYGRREVRSFLLSSALFWLDQYHADALRVDGVASMLYLDYSRKPGEWIPNEHGGRENLSAISFLQRLNEEAYSLSPNSQTIAEESTAWPGVSRPTHAGGLGFGMKWDMGWMHDTLEYFAKNPVHRRYHHGELTFRSVYAFTENFMLPLSHDEVVHGKGSLLSRMPGDIWQRMANLRLLYGYMFACPGKKLIFMGNEFGQWREWDHDSSLDWDLLDDPRHAGVRQWVRDLNLLYAAEPSLHHSDFEPRGFRWIEANNADSGVLSLLRQSPRGRSVAVVINTTPVPRYAYRVGLPQAGYWRESLNGDALDYGGSGVGNLGGVTATDLSWHGLRASAELVVPPLAALFLTPERGGAG